MACLLFSLLLASRLVNPSLALYQQIKEYSGSTFFDEWNFNTDHYPTSGFSLYQSRQVSQVQGLIRTNQPGNSATKAAYIGVDNTFSAPNGRNSVRIESQATFNHNLVLADIAHAPGGVCGTWPSFWMLGADPWPLHGEIDIVEGVNDMNTNAMTLHTTSGAMINTQVVDSSDVSGTVQTQNCDINAANQPPNAGCTIKDDSDLSFGSGFNKIGGGVFAMEWTSAFIKIWFFPRTSIPGDIQSGKPVPSDAWGKPSSIFTGFDIDGHFRDLKLIFNTDFCGSFAGDLFSQSPTCSTLGQCDDFVRDNPSAFAEAYWLVNYVRVFQNDGKVASNSSAVTKRWERDGQSDVMRRSSKTRGRESSRHSSPHSLLQRAEKPTKHGLNMTRPQINEHQVEKERYNTMPMHKNCTDQGPNVQPPSINHSPFTTKPRPVLRKRVGGTAPSWKGRYQNRDDD